MAASASQKRHPALIRAPGSLFRTGLLAGLLAASMLCPESAQAQVFVTKDPRFPQSVTIAVLDAGGTAVGEFTVTENPAGPDDFSLTIYSNQTALTPNTRYTVFLTQSSTLGALPAQFLGEFTLQPPPTGINGNLGTSTYNPNANIFSVRTEIVDGFASANTSLQDANGIADVRAAGALALGANTIPLRWIRIYQASGNISVFGGSAFEVGGGLLLTAAAPIAIPFIPIVANAGDDQAKQIQPPIFSPFFQNGTVDLANRTVLLGGNSEGDIIDYDWQVLSADSPILIPTTGQIGVDKLVFFPTDLHDGDQFRFRLTVTGRDGDVSTDDVTVSFFAP